MATLDSVMTKLRNLLASLNTKTGRSDTTFNAAINALPSKKTQDNVSVSGKTVTAPSGIYFSQVQKSVSDVSGSIGGTATAGKATGVVTNMDKMAVVTSPTGTAGVDYFRVAATATGTAGSYTPKYTVSVAGYIGSTVTGSAQSVSVTGDTTGQKLYIPKAKFEVSGKNVKTTSSGGGYIPANTIVGTVDTGSVRTTSVVIDTTFTEMSGNYVDVHYTQYVNGQFVNQYQQVGVSRYVTLTNVAIGVPIILYCMGMYTYDPDGNMLGYWMGANMEEIMCYAVREGQVFSFAE